jgi:hypothetical protein
LGLLGGVIYTQSVFKSNPHKFIGSPLLHPSPVPVVSTNDAAQDIAASRYSAQLYAYTSSGMTIVGPKGWKALGSSSCSLNDPQVVLISQTETGKLELKKFHLTSASISVTIVTRMLF